MYLNALIQRTANWTPQVSGKGVDEPPVSSGGGTKRGGAIAAAATLDCTYF